jgi:hypothetical protein
MPLTRLRKRFALKLPVAKTADPPSQWWVDRAFARRADERRKRIAHASRQIERHVLPARRRDRGSGGEARSLARVGRR